MKISKTVAVIVTYNRKKLLMECLDAILGQTVMVDKIVLIDNASTDGTKECLEEKGYLGMEVVDYIQMPSNTGGAGGFYEGIKKAREEKCDWVWVMDDDTIPTPNCLEALLNAYNIIKDSGSEHIGETAVEPSFLASTVYGANGEFMNLPHINLKESDNGYAYWYKLLSDGIVGIRDATFVSILINMKAIKKCGLPCRDYFIWGDDSEYTLRLSKYYGDGYLVGKSKAVHKRIGARALSIDSEVDAKRIKMFHYLYRNQEINNRLYFSLNRKLYYYFAIIFKKLPILKQKNGWLKYKAYIVGIWESKLQYSKFEKYINKQLNDNLP